MISLQQAKLHLRVFHNAEDALIAVLIEAAEAAVNDYLGQELVDPIPPPVTAATLLLVCDLYENREAQGDRPFMANPTYRMLLEPYRVMSV